MSESSLKRWCDRGLIPVEKTAGGHRRLPVGGVLGFLRKQGHTLIEPEVLGLPSSAGRSEWTIERARTQFGESLVNGDEAVSRQIIADLFVSGHELTEICDKVIASAFHQIGELWSCGDVAVYQERRACGVALRLMHELRTYMQPTADGAPRAIGFSLSGDNYLLPLAMVELILRENGWDAASVGHSLPPETILRAIDEIQPPLLWLSSSFIEDEATFIESVNTIFDHIDSRGGTLLIGGRAIGEDLRKQIRYTVHCDDMQSLANFSRTMLRSMSR